MNYKQLENHKNKNVRAWTNEGEIFGKLKELLFKKTNICPRGSFKVKYFGLIETKKGEETVPIEDIYRT